MIFLFYQSKTGRPLLPNISPIKAYCRSHIKRTSKGNWPLWFLYYCLARFSQDLDMQRRLMLLDWKLYMKHFQYQLWIPFIRNVFLLGLGRVEVDCFVWKWWRDGQRSYCHVVTRQQQASCYNARSIRDAPGPAGHLYWTSQNMTCTST